jgi:hypothetical protein
MKKLLCYPNLMMPSPGRNSKMAKRFSKEEMPISDGMKNWNEDCNKLRVTIAAINIATHWEPLVIETLLSGRIRMNTSLGTM